MSRRSAPRRQRSLVARQLAEELGVSISTISRAFSPTAVISEKTRERVLARAAERGYRPNPHARSLITQRSGIIALVVSDLANPFYPDVLTRLTEALETAGYSVMLFCRTANQSLDHVVGRCLHYQPDAVLLLAVTMSSTAAEQVLESGAQLVMFNRYVPGVAASSITCDNRTGGAQVADYLIDRGLRRLAFLAGDAQATTDQDRWQGFRERCRVRGLACPRRIEAGSFTHEAGLRAARDVMRGSEPPEAIFAASDVLALGVLDAAREQRIEVPQALSVVGFDDVEMSRWASYDLTTVRQPVAAMIASTISAIDTRVTESESSKPGEAVTLPGEIIERGTVRRASPA